MNNPLLLRPPSSRSSGSSSPRPKLPSLSIPVAGSSGSLNSISRQQPTMKNDMIPHIGADNKNRHRLKLSLKTEGDSLIPPPQLDSLSPLSSGSRSPFTAEIIAAVDDNNHSAGGGGSSGGASIYNDVKDLNEESRNILSKRTNDKDVHELEPEEWKQISKSGAIQELGTLGEGNGGCVLKCKLRNKPTVFAMKTITANPNPEFQRQILRELNFNKSCNSPYIVKYYGTFMDEESATISIAMEYMGGKSLDAVYKNIKKRGGRIGEKVLGKIAESVLRGLSYLHDCKIIHRDIKPQNILLDLKGNVKLCDFGVSGEVVDSLATTFTGTSYYMAPERIKGQSYTVTSDVWSLGLTLLEVAQGRFPYHTMDEDKKTIPLMPIELLSMILEFTPVLNDEPEEGIQWSSAFRSFLEYCLIKDPSKRPSPRQMLDHPWIQGQIKKNVRMEKFVTQCWEVCLV